MLILYARFDYTELALPAIGTTLTLKTKALAAFRAFQKAGTSDSEWYFSG